MSLARWAAAALFAASLGGCSSDELVPIPGTTTRVSKPEIADNTELDLHVFTTEGDCRAADITRDEYVLCLPHVDRASGEVRLGYQFKLDEEPYPMPVVKEHFQVSHQGTIVRDGELGQAVTVFPHDPIEAKQLYVLLIDGSSSMAENNRMTQVRQALLLDEVKDAFFPFDVRTGVMLLQFTSGEPQPVGGKLEILYDKSDYDAAVRKLRVLSGYTHLYDAITWATGPLLQREDIQAAIDADQMAVTVVALTDGFNNLSRDDTCRDNAARLGTLVGHIDNARGESVDLRTRPTIFTVGLGRPLRPRFELPPRNLKEVRPRDLCGKRFVDRRIDGDLETLGIDNASLSWIAEVGGGQSYVRRGKKGLGEAFRNAAAKRYSWFEVRYRIDPFYLRRSFTTQLRLTSFATAEATVSIFPSAWLDAPPGRVGPDGWTLPQSYLHTLVVVTPLIGLFIALGHLGAAGFNTRRALFGRTRRKAPRAASAPRAAPAPPPEPPAPAR